MSNFVNKFKFWTEIILRLIPRTYNFYKNKRHVKRLRDEFVPKKMTDIGSAKGLTILPLSEFVTASDDLVGEPGPSYLIKADDTTILFDTGFNLRQAHPSPLLRNIETLNINIKDIQYIVISHLHVDHVGGWKSVARRTFTISPEDVDLGHVREAFTPVPMNHPTIKKLTLTDRPHVIAPGVAIEGTIGRALYFSGLIQEQAMAVNVEGKGIILIIGCGHQGVKRIVERAEQIFEEPIYGIVGGLHYVIGGISAPDARARGVEDARQKQRYFGLSKLPWQRVTRSEVHETIDYLQTKNLGLISISPHDSCDWTINAFREAFPDIYKKIAVGREISI